MHIRIKHNIWLDNIKNLRQYILRYTVANSKSLWNVASDWPKSGFTSLQVLARFYVAASISTWC